MPSHLQLPHSSRHGVILSPHGFHVVHRNRCFGAFHVEWAVDLLSLELCYQTEVVASLGVTPSLFADMDGLGLPLRVREVAIIVFAATHEGIRTGMPERARTNLVENTLADHGLDHFSIVDLIPKAA